MREWFFILVVPLVCSSCATPPEYYILPDRAPVVDVPVVVPNLPSAVVEPVVVPVPETPAAPTPAPDFTTVPSHYTIPAAAPQAAETNPKATTLHPRNEENPRQIPKKKRPRR